MITSRLSANAALFALIATAAILYSNVVPQQATNEIALKSSAKPVVVAQLPRVEVTGVRKTAVN